MGCKLFHTSTLVTSRNISRARGWGSSYLLRVVLEGQKADPSENGLKSGGGNVAPVEHPVELAAIDEVAFERR